MKKILLVYTAALGYGHKRSAQAIETALNIYYPKHKTYLINALSTVHPSIEKFFGGFRRYTLKFFPGLWGFIYKNEEKLLKIFSLVEKFSENIFIKKFQEMLLEYKPDVIVATQAFPSKVFSVIKKKDNLKIPIIYVTTDFDIHSYHINCGADIFIVPNAEIKNAMVKKGLKNPIKIMGIPIGLEFDKIKNRKILQKKYNLKEKITVFILGGGSGLGYIENIIREIKKSKQDVQIMVSIGVNKSLGQRIQKDFNDVYLVGYTKDIDELYRISDIAITKPGGLTVSELLAMEIPMIITNPLPGLEEKNSNYLVKKKVAIYSKNIKDIPNIIEDLISNHDKLNKMKKNSKALSKPKAALHVAEIINNI